MALKLTMANAPEGVRTEFEFDGVGRVAIGRDATCDWVIPDPTRGVSGRHCEIVNDGKVLTLRDTSTNGVFVNGAGQRLEQAHVLRSGDSFSIGRFIVRAEVTNGPARLAGVPIDVAPPPPPRDIGLRGADPAAMVAAGSGRAVPSAAHGFPQADGGMTIISAAPRPGAASSPPPAPPQARPTPVDNPWIEPFPPAREPPSEPTVPSPALSVAASSSDSFSLAPLVEALGVPVLALGGQDAETTLRRIGALLAAFASGYAALLAEQGQARRKLGSRQLARPFRLQAGASAFSGPPAKMLQRLLTEADPGALVSGAASTIAGHQRALLDGALMAARELGQALDPGTLGAEGGPFFADHYSNLWSAIDPKWSAGFEEAFRLQYGAAYDEAAGDPGEATR